LLDTLAEWNIYLDRAWRQLVGHEAPQMKPFEVHVTAYRVSAFACLDDAP
jgi:hypothetical protein